MSKYDEYDAKLIELIASGKDSAGVLEYKTELRALAEPHRTIDRWGSKTEYYRVVDRRLQALRKAGRLQYHAGRWHVLGKS
jgi:hypothetical protein